MNNLYKCMTLLSSIGFGLALLCSSVATAQPSNPVIEPPPIRPGGAPPSLRPSSPPPMSPGSPPIWQGVTTELPGDFHFPPQMKAEMKKAREQFKQLGYAKVDDASVFRLDRRNMRVKERKAKKEVMKPMSEVRPTLGFEPADLRFSPLGKAELLEIIPAGAYNNGKWDTVNQLFRVKGFGLVSLKEWDYKFSGGGMYMDPEGINQNVNGRQASLVVQKGASGQGLTKLVWWDEEKVYTLMVNRALLSRPAVDKFIQLAESIQ